MPTDFDLIIRGGTIVTHSERSYGDIGIADGVIRFVGQLRGAKADRDVDASGAFVIPGIIDPHVHLSILSVHEDDQAQVDAIKRDLESETLAAAFGGVTTPLVMLNLRGLYLPMIAELVQAVSDRAYVDVGFTAIVSSEDHLAELPVLAEQGISGFKHFLNAYRKDRLLDDSALALLPVDEELFLASLDTIRKIGGPALAMVHAEDVDVISFLESRQRSLTSAPDLRSLALARPPICESIRMHYAATLAEHMGARLHICHCTSYQGLDVVDPFVRRGAPVSMEAVTHSLTSTYDVWDQVGVWGKFSPPLRAEEDRRSLWAGLRNGTIQHVASDHCAWTKEEKEGGGGQFGSVWGAQPGISNGLEHLLPAIVTYGIKTGELDWEMLVRITSYNTARRFGYYPKKGSIGIGADADLVVVDPNKGEVVDHAFYHGRGKELSLYWGQTLFGRPIATVSRGEVVQERGELCADNRARAEYVKSIR